MKEQRLVSAIENGTVIDHIPADKTFQVVSLLGLDREGQPVTIGYNYVSKKLGRKGIVKVSDRVFSADEINRLSVVAPNIVISVIRDYEVVEKTQVVTPKELRGIVRCANPMCITNHEPMATLFHVEGSTLTCHYCEKEQELSKARF